MLSVHRVLAKDPRFNSHQANISTFADGPALTLLVACYYVETDRL